MEENHNQVYVRKVILWADHKPLVFTSQIEAPGIAFQETTANTTYLRQYDCEIRYKPGKEMLLADTLSRA